MGYIIYILYTLEISLQLGSFKKITDNNADACIELYTSNEAS